jgi:hypothetical protein
MQCPNKSYIVSNIYRSPNPPSDFTIGEHLESFVETLDCHLARLSDCNCHSYVFLDANINLLHLHDAPICTAYLDTCITNGFLQLISKATRIQNNRNSLIDHMLTNSNLASYNTLIIAICVLGCTTITLFVKFSSAGKFFPFSYDQQTRI